MADQEQVRLLLTGASEWNGCREANPTIQVDLGGADLPGASLPYRNLTSANLNSANLCGANLWQCDLERAVLSFATLASADMRKSRLRRAFLISANLTDAVLTGASLEQADFNGANCSRADMRKTFLWNADLTCTDFTGADLTEADLTRCHMLKTVFDRATLASCSIYGISTWGISTAGTRQRDLIITPHDEPTITVENLQLAQFIYLLLNNQNIRHVIDTITSKVVLILGRFTPERKAILDAIRDELRKRDYLPVLFDFEKPSNRDITETVSTLAHMARFVIADITDARSIPQELIAIVPSLPSVPVQPLLLASQREYGMFEHFKRFPWVLEPYLYDDQDGLLAALKDRVIGPAEKKAKEQTGR